MDSNPSNGRVEPLQYTRFESSFGTFWVAFRGTTVHYADLDLSSDELERRCEARIGQRPVANGAIPARLNRWVAEFLAGKGPYRGPVDLSTVSPLQERALRVTMKIRHGEFRTYSSIAREIGSPHAARAVGDAMASNPIPILVPCHRVVRTDYHLVNYGAGGPEMKRRILLHEGVDISALERDARHGRRLYGCRTTHIFCLPTCPARPRVKPKNEVSFASEKDAVKAGYRACKLCKP